MTGILARLKPRDSFLLSHLPCPPLFHKHGMSLLWSLVMTSVSDLFGEHHLPLVTALGLNMVALSYGYINSVCSVDLLNSFLLKSRTHTRLNNTLKKQSYWKAGHVWTDGGTLTLSNHLKEHPHPPACLQRENRRIRNSRERTKGIFISDSCRLQQGINVEFNRRSSYLGHAANTLVEVLLCYRVGLLHNFLLLLHNNASQHNSK